MSDEKNTIKIQKSQNKFRSNFWPEKNMVNELNKYHDKVSKEFNLPEWIPKECPLCGCNLPPRCIREIGLCLNAKNIGDLFIEFHCDECGMMDTIYYRSEISNINDFCNLLDDADSPSSEPLVEEDMHNKKYNNLMTSFVADKEGNESI